MRDGFKRLRKKSGKGWIAVGATAAITLATILPTTTHLVQANSSESKETVPTYSQTKNWKANSVSNIQQAVNQVIIGDEYVIRWGDTLSGISYAVDISIADLAQANNLRNVDLIFAGDLLIIDKGKITDILGRDPQSADYNTGRVTAPARAPKSEEQVENLVQTEHVEDIREEVKNEISNNTDTGVEATKKDSNTVEFTFNKDYLSSLLDSYNQEFENTIPQPITNIDKETVEDDENDESTVDEVRNDDKIIDEESHDDLVNEELNDEVIEEPSNNDDEDLIEDELNDEVIEVPSNNDDKNPVEDEVNGDGVKEEDESENELPTKEGDTVVQERTEEPEQVINRETTYKTEVLELFLPESIGATLGETFEETLEVLEEPVEDAVGDDSVEEKTSEEESSTAEEPKDTETEETISAEDSTEEEATQEDDITEGEESEELAEETVKTVKVKAITPIHHGIQYVEDPELEIGEERLVQEGIDGQKETFSERKYDGEKIVEENVVNEETTEATDKIIAVGSKEPDIVEVQQVTTETVINPGHIRRPTSDLEKGIERVISEGLAGTRTRTYEVTYVNGVETNREVIENDLTNAPTDRVVEYGIKPIVRVIQETREEVIPYDTVAVYNENVAAGESKVTREGQNGTRKMVEDVTTIDGTETGREVVSTNVTVEPVDEVVEIGTQVTETKTETKTASISFETEYTTDSNLLEGEERIVTEGKNGVETTTFEVNYVNGEETNREQISKEVTTQPVSKVIANGTKKATSEGAVVRNVVYAVEHSDTLWSIAQNFGTSTKAIANATGISENTSLRSGQSLTIPTTKAKPMDNVQAYDGKQVVYLDPGHGGSDNGASGYGVTEEELNRTLYNMLKSELESRGYEVISSRETDRDISLTARSQDANASNADIFVSMHHNAFNGSAYGIETFYYEHSPGNPSYHNAENHNDAQRIANSAYLAQLIQENLVDETGAYDRGVKRNTFAVLRETDIPSVLIEYGFIDNYNENQKLQTASYQQKLTKAVADSIETYFTTVH